MLAELSHELEPRGQRGSEKDLGPRVDSHRHSARVQHEVQSAPAPTLAKSSDQGSSPCAWNTSVYRKTSAVSFRQRNDWMWWRAGTPALGR
jgi:hypothetical protein